MLVLTLAAALSTTAFLPATAATAGPVSAAKAATAVTTAVDTFDRTTTAGWGSAPTGGAWTLTGGNQNFSTAGGVGRITALGAGWKLTSRLAALARTDTEVQSTVSLDVMPSGSGVDLDVLGRSIDATHAYLLRLKMQPTGVVRASLLQVNGTTTTTLAQTSLPGLTYTAGQALQVRLQVQGTNPTALRAKVWAVGQAEPGAWQVTASSTTAAMQKVGAVGYGLYTSSSTTVLPVTARFDNLWAGPTASAPVLAPPNAPPVTSFASTQADLAVSFDASASSDSDGSIVARRWDFGDGTSATTALADHTYSRSGAYQVTHSVTDDDGATAATTRTVTVVRTAVRDAFGRTTTGGWGSADAGGAWSSTGSATGFSTGDGAGAIVVGGAGLRLAGRLDEVARLDSEVQAMVSLDKVPTGASTDLDIAARGTADTHAYRVRLEVLPSGVVRASLVAVVDGTAAVLQQVDVPGVTFAAGDKLRVRLQVEGASPTTVRARVWESAQPQPSTWQLTAQDSTPALQDAGAVAVGVRTAAGATNLPNTARYSEVWGGPVADAPVITDPVVVLPSEPIGPPDASSTGVPAGTVLTVHQGDLTITTPNTVIDGLDIRGFVKIAAPGVVIRNSIIRGTATSVQRALLSSSSDTASVTIEDSELYAASPSGWIDGIRGWNITARRVNVHHVIDAVHIYGDNVAIESSWLHDNLHYLSDPAQGGGASHDDSIQIQMGTNIQITGNSISGAYNTGIQFTQDQGVVSDVTIAGNWADGGGCTINLAEKGVGPFEAIAITDNVFGRTTRVASCAIISPTTTVVQNERNFYTDGIAVTVRKGS